MARAIDNEERTMLDALSNALETSDSIDIFELTSIMTSAQDKDSIMFNIGLQNAVRRADSFTKTDVYRSSNRWDWVSPQLRESDFDD